MAQKYSAFSKVNSTVAALVFCAVAVLSVYCVVAVLNVLLQCWLSVYCVVAVFNVLV